MSDAEIGQDVKELEWVLRRISTFIKQKGREILQDFPITTPQFIALQWLKEEGDMTIGALSEKMYLANSTTTDLIDRMEKTGLVQRVRSETDRRVIEIRLLDRGRELIDEVILHRQAYLTEILASFQKEEIDRLKSLLSLLYQKMESRS